MAGLQGFRLLPRESIDAHAARIFPAGKGDNRATRQTSFAMLNVADDATMVVSI